MAERGFSFYMIISFDSLTQDSVPMRGRFVSMNLEDSPNNVSSYLLRRIIVTPREMKIMMSTPLNSTFTGGVMNVISQVLYMNQVHYKDYIYKVCKVSFNFIFIRGFCLNDVIRN